MSPGSSPAPVSSWERAKNTRSLFRPPGRTLGGTGGLVAGGIPSLQGTCGTCHDTPNVGNHSFATPLNIGTGDPDSSNPSANLGGLDISYLPSITVCKTDPTTGLPTSNCKTTTDLGQALIDGNFDHVGKIKGPILRGLSARRRISTTVPLGICWTSCASTRNGSI